MVSPYLEWGRQLLPAADEEAVLMAETYDQYLRRVYGTKCEASGESEVAK